MEIIGSILVILAGVVTLMALLTFINLMLPEMVQQAGRRMEAHLLRSFLVGLVNLLFFGAIAVLCAWLAQQVMPAAAAAFILASALMVLALVCFILVGLAALARLLGERLGGSKTPLSSLLRGALLLILSCLAPFVGWYLVTPLVFMAALGAVILSLFRRRPAAPPPDETPAA